jgi:polyisoprenoid-binding protein YceI
MLEQQPLIAYIKRTQQNDFRTTKYPEISFQTSHLRKEKKKNHVRTSKRLKITLVHAN